eukprot:243257-Lingulodinium_polyedra.AAC.1
MGLSGSPAKSIVWSQRSPRSHTEADSGFGGRRMPKGSGLCIQWRPLIQRIFDLFSGRSWRASDV